MKKAANKGGSVKVVIIALAVIVFGLANSQKAQAQTTTTTVPFSTEQFNECLGETISIQGTVHEVFQFTFDPLSGKFHTHRLIDSKGTGVVTAGDPARIGAQYTYSQSQDDEINGLTFPFEITDIFDQKMIAAGNVPSPVGGDDSYIRFQVHVTLNANGVLTAEVINPTLQCR